MVHDGTEDGVLGLLEGQPEGCRRGRFERTPRRRVEIHTGEVSSAYHTWPT